MKCLCCEQTFAEQLSLKNYCVNFRNVDKNNHFFKKNLLGPKFFYRESVFIVITFV